MSLIACYCRVSTRHQKNDSQRAEIKRWLKNNGLDLSTVRWFEDKETGATTRRFAFEQLQKAIFDGLVKTVVVWKLDRISRRQRDGINVLADWCERDVRVVSVTQQIDLSGAVGRMRNARRQELKWLGRKAFIPGARKAPRKASLSVQGRSRIRGLLLRKLSMRWP
jgi:DNA invertase Pin-like site-specific DNA recombinase